MSFKAAESLAEQIAKHLASLIVRGELKPNERIPESRIAGELEVSRGSVREALLILERRYLIDILPRRGAVVTDVTIEQIKAVYEVYTQLLIILARKVCTAWSGADLDPMIKHFDTMKKAKDKGGQLDQIFELGFELMEQALDIANNPYLTETLTNFKPSIQRTYYMALKNQQGDLSDNVDFFSALVEAVIKRKPDLAANLVSEYADQQMQEVLSTLDH
jgi:DNA-binding GntR family transcriptional regulator